MTKFDRTTFRRPFYQNRSGLRKLGSNIRKTAFNQRGKNVRVIPSAKKGIKVRANQKADPLTRRILAITNKFNYPNRSVYEKNIRLFRNLSFVALEEIPVADEHVYALDVTGKGKVAFTLRTPQGTPDDWGKWEGYRIENNFIPLIKEISPRLNYKKFGPIYFIDSTGLTEIILENREEIKEEEIHFAAKLFCIFNNIAKYRYHSVERPVIT